MACPLSVPLSPSQSLKIPLSPSQSLSVPLSDWEGLRGIERDWEGLRFKIPLSPSQSLAGPRSPAQLTSFCPALLGHLVKPANGSRGRDLQRSTSCNPRILQGRGMFDGEAFLLGEGFSRGRSLFSIIFKLWYKRTPLTGKPRHERPPLPSQICLTDFFFCDVIYIYIWQAWFQIWPRRFAIFARSTSIK